jgi:hypothetical protein
MSLGNTYLSMGLIVIDDMANWRVLRIRIAASAITAIERYWIPQWIALL